MTEEEKRKRGNERNNAWRNNNKDRRNKYQSKYYAEHKEHMREYMKEYRKNNLEKCRERERVYRKNNPEKRRQSVKNWAIKFPEKARIKNLNKRLRRSLQINYGITVDKLNEMNLEQNGMCAICGKTNKNGVRLGVDHNHITGNIRGLLCGKCNAGIGLLGDDQELLISALSYLRKHDGVIENLNKYGGA